MATDDKKAKPYARQELTPLSDEQLKQAEQVVAESLKDNPELFNLPDTKYTVDSLVDFFVQSLEGSRKILPKEKRRYVIYLRKSTDDERKQVRSIEDQRKECLDLAKRLDIKVRPEDIFDERWSAKTSGKRDIFNAMMNGFEIGKYHGLISWSPDRLSRNMLEGGQIIEHVDHEKIQDLLFCTYAFDNTPNGKMMLGILFATSKQYSDKLAVDVARGITGAIHEGKYVGLVKKGYYADIDTGRFMPDGVHWQLLRQAVAMRLKDGRTNQEVADFLNASNFSFRKSQDDTYKKAKMDKKTVATIFTDPFYTGAYKYGDNITNLNDTYNFLPLMTPDEFIALSRNMSDSFNAKFVGRNNVSKRLEFGLLREKVICDYCSKIMTFQRTQIKRGKNAGSWQLTYYCRNKDCVRHNDEEAIRKYGKKLARSVSARFITAHIEWTLRHMTANILEAHKHYISRIEKQVAIDKEIAKRKLSEARAELKRQKDKYSQYQSFQVEDPETYKKHHAGKLEFHQAQINAVNASLASLQKELDGLNKALPSREEFVELIKSYLKTILQTRDLIEEDAVYRELVLNLRAGDNAVSVIKLNPPYDMMVDFSKNTSWSG
ncbi:MAG: recombinase family protein [Candidatus Nomurabacteria bacterium]|nr:MAG: recombinase family protein [Candidatus Nomurabacteria bacterium]